jgi:molybdopterin/thiamine biosynthesis adenylyltransferase
LLSENETIRYSRHLILKGFGASAQSKLKAARVLVIGAGGLGSPALAYWAAAGGGHLTIIDDDRVELSNLQRQIAHSQDDIGRQKATSGAEFASAINSDIKITPICERVNDENAQNLIVPQHVIIERTDRFSTRAMIAQNCQISERPLVSGAVSMFDGQLSVFAPHLLDKAGLAFPSFSCLYPEIPNDDDLPACETNGILGATTGIIGTLMAMEAIKIITGIGEPLIGRLLLYDGRAARFTELKYARK